MLLIDLKLVFNQGEKLSQFKNPTLTNSSSPLRRIDLHIIRFNSLIDKSDVAYYQISHFNYNLLQAVNWKNTSILIHSAVINLLARSKEEEKTNFKIRAWELIWNNWTSWIKQLLWLQDNIIIMICLCKIE